MNSSMTGRKKTEATMGKKIERTIGNATRAKAKRRAGTTAAAVAATTAKKASHRPVKIEAKKRKETKRRKMEVTARIKIKNGAKKRRIGAIAADTKKTDLRRHLQKIKIGRHCIGNRGLVFFDSLSSWKSRFL